MESLTEAEYLAQASDPTLTSEQVEVLWAVFDNYFFPLGQAVGIRLKNVLASNPSLTPELAKHCFGRHAVALAENPVLPLLLMERPNLADSAPAETVLRLLRKPSAPVEMVRILSRHPQRQVAESARLHVSLYGEASAQQVLDELAAMPIGGKEKLSTLHSWGLVPEWLVVRHKLRAPKPPVLPPQIEGSVNERPVEKAEWDTLRHSTRRRERLVQDPHLPADILRAMAESAWGKQFVGNHPASPLDLLVALELDQSLLARTDAPFELKASAAARQVARGGTSGLVVVLSLAHTIGENLLHEAALSSRWIKRLGAALNARTRGADQERLIDDANALVRAVMRDPALRGRLLSDGER